MTGAEVFDAARDGVVVVVELRRATLQVVGPDAKSWLSGLVSCDLSGVDATHGAYGLLLTKQGKIQSDVDVLSSREGRLYLSLAPGTVETLFGVLDRHLVMEDAELARAEDTVFVRLLGAGARSVSEALSVHPAVRAAGTVDWLGLGGAALACEQGALEDVVDAALERAGKGLRATEEAWQALRISRAFPVFGQDYGPEDNPHEASLEGLAVSFNKGCYLGQEVVCMQDMRGRVKRRLVALEVSGSGAGVGADVTADGVADKVGEVTSVARSGASLYCIARVRAPYFEPGTALFVAGAATKRLSE